MSSFFREITWLNTHKHTHTNQLPFISRAAAPESPVRSPVDHTTWEPQWFLSRQICSDCLTAAAPGLGDLGWFLPGELTGLAKLLM